MKYSEFLVKVDEFHATHPHFRYGQSFFNYLHSIKPALANSIRATPMDCFYSNFVSLELQRHLEKNWEVA